MLKQVDELLLSLFNKRDVDQLDLVELEALARESPYSSLLQLAYALKVKASGDSTSDRVLSRAALHFPDNLWFVDLVHHNSTVQQDVFPDQDSFSALDLNAVETPAEKDMEPTVPPTEQKTHSSDSLADQGMVPFDPYHTVDYFASQGIKLSQVDHSDQLGIKLRSFTAWLKTMKKLQVEVSAHPDDHGAGNRDDMYIPQHELVATEAMAEVYLKQGLSEKAIAVYTKLSLQNPANSHIFAHKIADIKNRL